MAVRFNPDGPYGPGLILRDLAFFCPVKAEDLRCTPLFTYSKGRDALGYSLLKKVLKALLLKLLPAKGTMLFTWHFLRSGLACALRAAKRRAECSLLCYANVLSLLSLAMGASSLKLSPLGWTMPRRKMKKYSRRRAFLVYLNARQRFRIGCRTAPTSFLSVLGLSTSASQSSKHSRTNYLNTMTILVWLSLPLSQTKIKQKR
jgi:hypothetical protein